jgi:TonB family protein
MSDAAALPLSDLTALVSPPAREVTTKDDRRFYIGLALAAAFHSLLFAGFYSSPPRFIGDPSGDKNAVDVTFVTDAELRSLATAASAPQGNPVPPAPPPSPPAPAEAAATPPPSPSEPAVQRSPQEPVAQPSQQEPAAASKPRETAVPEEALTLKPPEETPLKEEAKPEAKPEARPEPKPTAPPKAEPAPPAKQVKPDRTNMARLDLSPPPVFSAPSSGGRGTDLARPPGATRSGENDAFGRGVVAALRKTMPQLASSTGRVTVRITLDMDGALVRTEVVRPSNVADLDRYVVFATRQTSYPFPPRNAKAADLVFLITYIYH